MQHCPPPCYPPRLHPHSREACLKFWDSASSTSGASGHHQPFLLNTRADEPHGGGVAGLAYHPSRDMAVTTGAGAARAQAGEVPLRGACICG